MYPEIKDIARIHPEFTERYGRVEVRTGSVYKDVERPEILGGAEYADENALALVRCIGSVIEAYARRDSGTGDENTGKIIAAGEEFSREMKNIFSAAGLHKFADLNRIKPITTYDYSSLRPDDYTELTDDEDPRQENTLTLKPITALPFTAEHAEAIKNNRDTAIEINKRHMSLQYAIAECVERTITQLNEIESNTSPKYSLMASGKTLSRIKAGDIIVDGIPGNPASIKDLPASDDIDETTYNRTPAPEKYPIISIRFKSGKTIQASEKTFSQYFPYIAQPSANRAADPGHDTPGETQESDWTSTAVNSIPLNVWEESIRAFWRVDKYQIIGGMLNRRRGLGGPSGLSIVLSYAKITRMPRLQSSSPFSWNRQGEMPVPRSSSMRCSTTHCPFPCLLTQKTMAQQAKKRRKSCSRQGGRDKGCRGVQSRNRLRKRFYSLCVVRGDVCIFGRCERDCFRCNAG